jgi:hypothetical protein
MSFLKQLLTPFVEFEDDKKKQGTPGNQQAAPGSKPAQQPAAPAAPTGTPATPATSLTPDENATHPLITSPAKAAATPPAHIPTYAPSGAISGPLPEHEQYFERLIDEANAKNPLFHGTDFKEFVDSKVDIDDIADETIRYRTAFNVLKSTGLTKEKLLSTGQEYLNLIGRDLNAFQGAHAQQYKKEVGQKEQLIQKKAQELQALTQRINALKGEINQLTQEITVTKDKLDTVKNSFLLAGEKKQTEIQTELEKIARLF